MKGIMEVTQTNKAITLDCGCNVSINLTFQGGEFVAISGTLSLCNLHMAAPKLLAALEGLLDNHCSLVSSGDCGFWNVEEESEVIQVRAAIEEAKK
jgi:hypothetical protein